jgi:hypothetical protein
MQLQRLNYVINVIKLAWMETATDKGFNQFGAEKTRLDGQYVWLTQCRANIPGMTMKIFNIPVSVCNVIHIFVTVYVIILLRILFYLKSL